MLRPWYLVIVANMFLVGILFGFLPVRIHELRLDPVASGFFLSLVAASYLLVQPVAGALADRVPAFLTIRVGLFLGAAGVVLAPFVEGPALAVVSIVAGMGVGTVWTNTDTLVSRLARRGRSRQARNHRLELNRRNALCAMGDHRAGPPRAN